MWERGRVDVTPRSSYENGRQRGEYCLIDSSLAAVPDHSQTLTADPKGLLVPEDHYRIAYYFLLRPPLKRRSCDQLKHTRIHMGSRPGHYPSIFSKMKDAVTI